MVFGLGFTEWMALIGGYPTIFSTFLFMGIIAYAGTNAIYKHNDYRDIKTSINEALTCEEEIKDILFKTKPLTRRRFKQFIGKEAYMELTYTKKKQKASLTFKEKYMLFKLKRGIKRLENKKLKTTDRLI